MSTAAPAMHPREAGERGGDAYVYPTGYPTVRIVCISARTDGYQVVHVDMMSIYG